MLLQEFTNGNVSFSPNNLTSFTDIFLPILIAYTDKL